MTAHMIIINHSRKGEGLLLFAVTAMLEGGLLESWSEESEYGKYKDFVWRRKERRYGGQRGLHELSMVTAVWYRIEVT